MTAPARKPPIQVMCYIGREVDALDAGINRTPLNMSALPAGASPNTISCLLTQGWETTGGEGVHVQIGTLAEPTKFWDSNFPVGPDPARIDTGVDPTVCRPLDADTEVFVTLIPDLPNSVITAGHMILWLSFLPHPLMRDVFAPW